MSFLNPLFFWAFLSLIPLALVYLLKVRPRRKPTTAYFLWEDIFQERRPNRLFQRLRDLWSLLLMALAFSAVCLALAGPELTDDDRKDVLLLIDNSASMNATESGKTRLEKAKQAAVDILRAFNGTQRAAVASVSNSIKYRSRLSSNPRELIDAVQSIEASDFEFQTDHFSGNKHDWLSQQRSLLISDGAFDTSKLPATVELMKIGKPAKNMGIVSADLRRLPGAQRLGLYFRVYSSHAAEIDMLVYEGRNSDSLFRVIPISVQSGLNTPHVFELEGAGAGDWMIRLDADDALPNDNVARLSIPPSQPIRVQVDTDDRFFFENCVIAFSGDSGLLELVSESPDIVISQGKITNAAKSLVFRPRGESAWWSNVGESLEAAIPRVLIEDHPVLRHIDFASISFVGAVELTIPDTAQVLVSSDNEIPLVYRVSESGNTHIIVNMDPVASEFYFSAWFPVLVHGTATHLVGREDSLLASYRPGDSVPIAGAQESSITEVMLPDSTTVSVTSKKLAPLEAVGYYRLANELGKWSIASSLLSGQESSIDNSTVTDTSKPISQGWPLSHLLTILAVLVLGAESVLFHRRKVG